MRLAGNRLSIRLHRQIYRLTAGFTGADVLAELRETFATIEPVLPNGDTHELMTAVLATKAA
jgi:hypothetical protein